MKRNVKVRKMDLIKKEPSNDESVNHLKVLYILLFHYLGYY